MKPDRPLLIAAGAAAAALLLHMLTNGQYGYFRDELYFLAGGQHLAWGYVDHAPMIGLFAWLTRAVFGDSLHALRFLPAVAAAITVFLTGLIARELGGRSFAVLLACVSVLLVPVFLILQTLFSMNAFEPVFWLGALYVLLLAIRRDRPRLLPWFGLLVGLGLENKHSTVFLGAAVFAAILLSPQRRWLKSGWLWLAGAIAGLVFLPNLLWQIQHHWPTLEDLENVRRLHKNVELPPLPFLGQQLLMLNPLNAIAWLAGLAYLLFHPDGRRSRLLGFTYLVLLAIMMALHGKDYYLAPIYPLLFAAGGVAWERLAEPRPALRWLRYALPALILAVGVVFAPMGLPVLSPENYLRYTRALGVQPPKTEVHHQGALPQHFGDMFGWPEMVEKVAQVYRALAPEERAQAAIFAGNYGEAGAIDFFGPRYGLPKAISAHQTYFFWGPRDYTGEIVILLQANRREVEQYFRSVETGPHVSHPWAMAEEDYDILVCRGLKAPLRAVWPKLKHWN